MRWHPGGSQGWGLSPSGSWHTYPEGHASLWKCVCCLICWPESSTLVWPYYIVCFYPALPDQMVESTCNAGDPVSFPGWEDPLGKKMATHCSILAWEIPWTGEPSGLEFTGSQGVGHNWATFTFIFLLSYFYADVPQAPQSLCVKFNLFSQTTPPPPNPDEYFSHTANPQTGCQGSPLNQPPYPPHPVVCFLSFLNHLFLFIPNTTPSVCFQVWGLEWRVQSSEPNWNVSSSPCLLVWMTVRSGVGRSVAVRVVLTLSHPLSPAEFPKPHSFPHLLRRPPAPLFI